MQDDPFGPLIWGVILLVVGLLFARHRRRRRRVGSAGAGTVYDWLNEDKRNAVALIVEERAEARDPETADGNLPELQDPTDRPPGR